MASFVIETYVSGGDSGRFADDVVGIGEAARRLGAVPAVQHLRSYLVPSDEMGFHVIEAEDAVEVSRVARLASVEVERIVRVIGIDPADSGTDGRGSWRRVEASGHDRGELR
ncbi:MAG TPA: hypothetical protein VFR14_09215 [Candidatus Limnocylindrales bacterium]|nr:hypothetical protein [Candidatus Limnocylindrales bacterium]